MFHLRLPAFLFFVSLITVTQSQDCKVVETVDNFDIDVYASKPWYSHQQALNRYSPISQNYCVKAEYTVRDEATFWGYTVAVSNTAKNVNGREFGGRLCAYQTGDSGTDLSKLAVSPCYLPQFAAGPYWVVAYDEAEGYALISGGQPDEESEDGNAGCRTGTGVNNSGLWIFTRSQIRDEALITLVRSIAQDKGFDISVLNDVDHTNCTPSAPPSLSPSISNAPSASPITMSPTVSSAPVAAPECADSEDDFYVLFRGNKDCEWVGNWNKRGRCFFYGDHCPETCGQCD